MADRYLIINADDFGNSEGSNIVINRLFKEKRITSSTLMAPAVKADQALEMASSNNWAVKLGFEHLKDDDVLAYYSLVL